MTVKDPSLKLSAKDEVSYYLSLTSLLVVSRHAGRGSDPVKRVNIIFNN